MEVRVPSAVERNIVTLDELSHVGHVALLGPRLSLCVCTYGTRLLREKKSRKREQNLRDRNQFWHP
jgi:hypothetical protein